MRTIARPRATRWRWPPLQLRRARVEQILDFQGGRRRAHPAIDVAAVEARDFERKGDVGENGHVRVKGVALKDHGDIAAPRRQKLFGGDRHHLPVPDADLARTRVLDAGDDVEQGRLAAAAGPHQDEKSARLHGQIEGLEGPDATAPQGEKVFSQIFDDDAIHPLTAPWTSP